MKLEVLPAPPSQPGVHICAMRFIISDLVTLVYDGAEVANATAEKAPQNTLFFYKEYLTPVK